MAESKNLIDELNELSPLFRKLFRLPGIRNIVSSRIILRILNDEKAKKLLNYEVVSYLFFGTMATALRMISFLVLIELLTKFLLSFGGSFGVFEITDKIEMIVTTISNTISVVSAVLFQYFTNSKLVFLSKAETAMEKWTEFFKFTSARGVTMLLEFTAVPFLIYLGFPKLGSAAFITIFVIIINYIFSKLLVFKRKKV